MPRTKPASDYLKSSGNLTVIDVSHVDALHLTPNQVMAEVFANNGVAPDSSEIFEFKYQDSGIISVFRRQQKN